MGAIFDKAQLDFFVPDGTAAGPALARTTHLGIGAHQDDLEMMALAGILNCYGRADRWFTGVTCTDGGGSARSGPYAGIDDGEMRAIRAAEQRNAAMIGQYGAMLQLNYSSAEIKRSGNTALPADLEEILRAAQPERVYTHNLADKHETHVAVVVPVIRALRALPAGGRPSRVIGCEVWRDLDWLPDEAKVVMEIRGREHLAAALIGVFDSQIAGGKRYDLAAAGRRRAHATHHTSHSVDGAAGIILGMDLTPLVTDPTRDILHYVTELIDEFRESVRGALARQMG